jgi:phospholipid transport system substrate-binding protein
MLTDIIDPPNTAALNIITSALSSLKEIRKQGQSTPENIKKLIEIKLLPNIATSVSTRLTLKKYWDELNNEQKNLFKKYITQSLIKDYAGALGAYNQLNSISISVDPEVKRRDNKAIVKLFISLDDDSKPFKLTLKMVRLDHWRVYDVLFSGVSMIKNYQEQFNSHIRRKGIDSLIEKITKKLSQG